MEGICDTPVVYGVTAGEDSGKVGRVSNLLVVPTVVVGDFRGGLQCAQHHLDALYNRVRLR